MKYVYPAINNVFIFGEEKINTLIIENKKLFLDIITDIFSATEGMDAKSVLSDEKGIIPINKNMELISSFVPFEINRKALLNKISSFVEEKALSADNYEKSMLLIGQIEQYMDELTNDCSCEFKYCKNNISSLIKSIGMEIQDDSNDLIEKIVNYIELIREFDKDKLFVLVGLRNYFDDESIKLFFNTCIKHKMNIFCIESVAYSLLENENRYTIDEDLCEF